MKTHANIYGSEIMTKFTFLISKPAFDKIASFTGARIALQSIVEGNEATVILMEDGIYCGVQAQESKDFFNISELLENFLGMGGKVLVCGMCIKERGIPKESLLEGCEIIDLSKLVKAMAESDQTVFF